MLAAGSTCRPLQPTTCRPSTSATSQAGACLHLRARRQQGKRGPRPCRITNEGKEVWQQLGVQDLAQQDYIETSETQVFDPERGPLESRVNRFFLDAVGSDEVDLEETAYWFSEPQDGWSTGTKRRKWAEEAEVEFAAADHPGEGRIPVSDLEEGQEVTGLVTDVWLYHGIEVDIGCDFDGLVPVWQDEWTEAVFEEVMPGTTLRFRVHKLRRPHLYRWPVQLEILEPAGLQEQICPPEDWESPIDMEWADNQGWDMERIMAETGRTYTSMGYYPERDLEDDMEELQQAYGWDEPDINGAQVDEVTESLDPSTAARIELEAADQLQP